MFVRNHKVTFRYYGGEAAIIIKVNEGFHDEITVCRLQPEGNNLNETIEAAMHAVLASLLQKLVVKEPKHDSASIPRTDTTAT